MAYKSHSNIIAEVYWLKLSYYSLFYSLFYSPPYFIWFVNGQNNFSNNRTTADHIKSFCDNYCDASDWDDGGSSTDGVDVDTDEDHSLVNVIYDDHDSLINNSSTNWCIFTPFYLNYPQFVISWQMFSRLFLFTEWSLGSSNHLWHNTSVLWLICRNQHLWISGFIT